MGTGSSGRVLESREYLTPLQRLRLKYRRAAAVPATLDDVGKACDIAESTLCAFELGRIDIPREAQARLAAFYGVQDLALRRMWIRSRKAWLEGKIQEVDREMRATRKQQPTEASSG